MALPALCPTRSSCTQPGCTCCLPRDALPFPPTPSVPEPTWPTALAPSVGGDPECIPLRPWHGTPADVWIPAQYACVRQLARQAARHSRARAALTAPSRSSWGGEQALAARVCREDRSPPGPTLPPLPTLSGAQLGRGGGRVRACVCTRACVGWRVARRAQSLLLRSGAAALPPQRPGRVCVRWGGPAGTRTRPRRARRGPARPT